MQTCFTMHKIRWSLVFIHFSNSLSSIISLFQMAKFSFISPVMFSSYLLHGPGLRSVPPVHLLSVLLESILLLLAGRHSLLACTQTDWARKPKKLGLVTGKLRRWGDIIPSFRVLLPAQLYIFWRIVDLGLIPCIISFHILWKKHTWVFSLDFRLGMLLVAYFNDKRH